MKRSKMKVGKITVAAVLLLSLLTACYYDVEEELYPSDECNVTDVTYTGSVLSIIVSRCYKCHDQANQQGGIILEGHANLARFANSGQLLGAIQHKPGFSAMPQGESQLPDCQIQTIAAWVEDGAPNN